MPWGRLMASVGGAGGQFPWPMSLAGEVAAGGVQAAASALAGCSVQAAARASGWLRESRVADRVARASGTHLPQQVPTPSSRVRSRRLVAPPFTAVRICLSETALQTQMIMELL